MQASLLHAIGVVARGLGLYAQATSVLQSALDTRIRLFGERHADVASSHNELARALVEFGMKSPRVNMRAWPWTF